MSPLPLPLAPSEVRLYKRTEDGPLVTAEPLSLEKVQQLAAPPSAISLEPTQSPRELTTLFSGVLFAPESPLRLIVLTMETIGDGRLLSQAVFLRRALGYRGELRARGALRPDAYRQLRAVGFDAFELPQYFSAERFEAAAAQLSQAAALNLPQLNHSSYEESMRGVRQRKTQGDNAKI